VCMGALTIGSTNGSSRPQLLGVSPAHIHTAELPSTENKVDENDREELIPQPHRDERQIRLDTDRSFVLYPVGELLPFSMLINVTYWMTGRPPRLTKKLCKKTCMRS
jgi:hypothetical protein